MARMYARMSGCICGNSGLYPIPMLGEIFSTDMPWEDILPRHPLGRYSGFNSDIPWGDILVSIQTYLGKMSCV